MTLHVCSRRHVREAVGVCMSFPVCLCLGDESPGESQGLSPKLSDAFVNGGGLGLVVVVVVFFFFSGGGVKRRRE